MSMKIGVGVAAAIFAATVCAETFKGAVSVSLYPSVEELAQAYAKSEDADWRKVAADLIASRGEVQKKTSIANKAVVELQTLSGFNTIRKVVVGDDGSFSIEHVDKDSDCRVFCVYEVDGKVLTAATHPVWEDGDICICRPMQLRDDHTSAIGRCVDTNGMPVANAIVRVDLVRTPVEVEESWFHRPKFGKSDLNGYWRVDEIGTPSFYDTLIRICNTNVVNMFDSKVPPYGIEVSAEAQSNKAAISGCVDVPNVTARQHAAAEQIFAVYKRKTGKDWPRPAPMTDFPVSTNNVIYVPDIVLK